MVHQKNETIEIKKFGNKKKVSMEENACVDQVTQLYENREKVEIVEEEDQGNQTESLDSHETAMDEIKSQTESKLSEIIENKMEGDDLTVCSIKESAGKDEEDFQKTFEDIPSDDMNSSTDLKVGEKAEKRDVSDITVEDEKEENKGTKISLSDRIEREAMNSLDEPSIVFIKQDEMKTIELQSSMGRQDTSVSYPLRSEEKNYKCDIEKRGSETLNGFDNHFNQHSYSYNPAEPLSQIQLLEKDADVNLVFSTPTSEPFTYSLKETLENSSLHGNLFDTSRPLQSTGIVSHNITSDVQTLPASDNNVMTLHAKPLNIEIIYPPREILDDNLTNVPRAARRTPEETYNPSFEERLAEYNSTLLYLNSHLKDTEYYTSLPFVRNAAGHAYFLPKGSVLPNIFVNLPSTSRPTHYSSLPSQTIPKTQTTILQPKFSFFNKLFHCCSSSNIDPSDLDSPRALYKNNAANSQSLRMITTNRSFSETSQLPTYDNKTSVIQ